MPKASKITIRTPDGRTEIVGPGHFAKRKFSYSRYRRSAHWRDLRRQVLARDENRCARCKVQDRKLEVHHITYERVGRELLEDLTTLCQRCHATEHQWRKRAAA